MTRPPDKAARSQGSSIGNTVGRRIEKSIDADGAGAGTAEVVHYVYDGDHIALALTAATT